MNRWVGIGRLCSDVELRHTQSGIAIASYRLAVNRGYKSDGQPDADFITCVCWGKTAEFAEKYLQKGTKIAVEGRISTRSYEDNDGKKRTAVEITVERHEFCESKKEQRNGEPEYMPPTQAHDKQAGRSEDSPPEDYEQTGFQQIAYTDDDDLPF